MEIITVFHKHEDLWTSLGGLFHSLTSAIEYVESETDVSGWNWFGEGIESYCLHDDGKSKFWFDVYVVIE